MELLLVILEYCHFADLIHASMLVRVHGCSFLYRGYYSQMSWSSLISGPSFVIFPELYVRIDYIGDVLVEIEHFTTTYLNFD